MKRSLLIAIALTTSSCAVADAIVGNPTVRIYPEERDLAIGSRHDVIVIACQNELDVGRLLGGALGIAVLSSVGRVDSIVAAPSLFIPSCEAIPFTITGARIESPALDVEISTEFPNVLTVSAVGEGEGTLMVDVLLDGDEDARTLESRFSSRTPTNLDVVNTCGEFFFDEVSPDYDLLGTGLEVPVAVLLEADGVALTGYGNDPLAAEGLELIVGEDESVALRTPDAPGTARLYSPVVASFERQLEIYDATSVDDLVVLTRFSDYRDPEFNPAFGGAAAINDEIRIQVPAVIGGRRPCNDTLTRIVTIETETACGVLDQPSSFAQDGWGAINLRTLAPGTCRVRFDLEGTAVTTTFEIEVAPGWRAVDDPVLAGLTLLDVWASGPADVWVVGFDDETMVGAIVRYDGTAWSRIDTGDMPVIGRVWGTGPGDVFVTGASGAIFRSDGVTFTDLSVDETAAVDAIWATQTGTLYAGGETFFYQHDGIEWMTVDSWPGEFIRDIWGTGPDDVYVAADATLWHYDGVEWSDTTPPFSVGTSESPRSLYAVWGTGPADIWVVGDASAHYDGVEWTELDGPRGYERIAAYDAHGADGRAYFSGSFFLEAMGDAAYAVPSPNELRAHHAVSGGEIYAIGSGLWHWLP